MSILVAEEINSCGKMLARAVDHLVGAHRLQPFPPIAQARTHLVASLTLKNFRVKLVGICDQTLEAEVLADVLVSISR